MSYDATFNGHFTFADRRCLLVGLAGFYEITEDPLNLGLLAIDDLTANIDFDGSVPASWYDDMHAALCALGACATTGSVAASFTMEKTSREMVGNGGCTSAEQLPDIDEVLVDDVEEWLAGGDDDGK